MGPVHEAVQLSLGRRVALRLLAGSEPASASVDHPNIVPIYEAGEWEGRRFVVSRLVRGESLATLLDSGSLTPGRFDQIMEAVAGAVAAAHGAGLVHGRLTAHNVIVDGAGTPFVTDFGIGRAGTFEGDRAALAALEALRPKRARRRPAVVAAVAATGLAVVVGLVLLRGEDGAETGAKKPVQSIGCASDPDPNTPPCTMSQDMVGGRQIRVQADGAVRGWSVRGAAGDLSLQVLRREGGRTVRVGFSQVARARDPGSHEFPASLNVERGDRIGVLLAPGARIGRRQRSGATAQRWDSGRTPLPRPSDFAGELLLRADVRAGARAVAPRQLTGARAAAAPEGRVLAQAQVDADASGRTDVRLVRVRRSIALDAFRGQRRLARIAVPDARVAGRVLELRGACEYPRAVCLEWLNDGTALPRVHAYTLAGDGRRFRMIG